MAGPFLLRAVSEGSERYVHDCTDATGVFLSSSAPEEVFRITVDRYDRMVESGLLGEDDPIELPQRGHGVEDAQEAEAFYRIAEMPAHDRASDSPGVARQGGARADPGLR